MKKLFQTMLDALKKNEDLVLCSIIASSGSTPRGSGAKMAVFADGTTFGTVGGGAVEFESIRCAKEALRERSTFTRGFDLSPNQTADIGMICGGKVVVYFQYYSKGDKAAIDMFDYIIRLFERDTNSWLVTQIAGDCVRQIGVYEEGKGLLFADIPEEAIKPLMKSRGVLQKGEPAYYVEPLVQAGTVYVFGGGHVAQELVPVIEHVGFRPVVYEDREAFVSEELFPAAAGTIVAPFGEVGKHIGITGKDYVVIMTRGHQCDYEVLEQAMRTPASYIGVIGSKHKIAATFKRLVEAGIPENELGRIHTPIGLPIKGETPAEIAISIAGELILHRADLSEKTS
jgi:xanthine dehydrogenase accessory factor